VACAYCFPSLVYPGRNPIRLIPGLWWIGNREIAYFFNFLIQNLN